LTRDTTGAWPDAAGYREVTNRSTKESAMATTTSRFTQKEARFLKELGQQLRVDSIRCSTAAGSGHPTSSMSAADLIAVLLTRHLLYDWHNPKEPANDHLIYSKGHASPLCYAMFKAAGVITDEELITFRKFGSRLQGHPTPILPWVDALFASAGRPRASSPIGITGRVCSTRTSA
jgi:transketolase